MNVNQSIQRWGVLFVYKNKIDGAKKYIDFENYAPVFFFTKQEAIQYIKMKYGYIAKRKDLRQEPYKWRMPKPIKLKITMSGKL